MKTDRVKKDKVKKEKDMKSTLKTLIPSVIIIAFLSTFLMITGNKKVNADLIDFETYVQEGIQVMAMHVEPAEDGGYLRTLSLEEDGENLYVTFFSTFGFNNEQGSINTFPVEIKPEYNKIHFYNSGAEQEFEQVMQKNAETGEWEIIK